MYILYYHVLEICNCLYAVKAKKKEIELQKRLCRGRSAAPGVFPGDDVQQILCQLSLVQRGSRTGFLGGVLVQVVEGGG